MVRHMVSWNFNPDLSEAEREEIGKTILSLNAAMISQIPGIICLETTIAPSGGGSNCDVAIYSEFESFEALAAYQKNPDHLDNVGAVVRKNCCERRCVDVEVS